MVLLVLFLKIIGIFDFHPKSAVGFKLGAIAGKKAETEL